jgi:glycosyltransferase involved in cell wall biosynthesis
VKSITKVLFISYDGMTDPLGQSQVLPYIAGLTKHGFEFHLISFEKMDRFAEHKRHIRSYCKEHNVFWHPQDYHNSRGLRKTVGKVRRMRKIAFYLNEQHNFSIVHCRSYITCLVGLKLKRKFDMKLVFDMRGFWPDERVDGKLWNLSNPIYRIIYNFFKKKEKEVLLAADYTVSLTENGKNEILSWKELAHKLPEIEIIPCCVDLELFDPNKITEEGKTELRAEIGLKDGAYILGYVGSIGTWYMLAEMLDYFRVLKESNASAKFLFISGESPEMIKSEAIKRGVDPADVYIKSTLHSGVPLHISLFTKSIFFIRATYSKKASSPTKQAEIMAMGIPLVCNSGVGDTDLIIERYESGDIIHTFDDESYRQSISNPRKFNTEKVKAGAEDYFSLEQGVERFLRIYKHVNG